MPPIISAGGLPVITYTRPIYVLGQIEKRHSIIQDAVAAEERRLLGSGKRTAQGGEAGGSEQVKWDPNGAMREGLAREIKRSRGEVVEDPENEEVNSEGKSSHKICHVTAPRIDIVVASIAAATTSAPQPAATATDPSPIAPVTAAPPSAPAPTLDIKSAEKETPLTGTMATTSPSSAAALPPDNAVSLSPPAESPFATDPAQAAADCRVIQHEMPAAATAQPPLYETRLPQSQPLGAEQEDTMDVDAAPTAGDGATVPETKPAIHKEADGVASHMAPSIAPQVATKSSIEPSSLSEVDEAASAEDNAAAMAGLGADIDMAESEPAPDVLASAEAILREKMKGAELADSGAGVTGEAEAVAKSPARNRRGSPRVTRQVAKNEPPAEGRTARRRARSSSVASVAEEAQVEPPVARSTRSTKASSAATEVKKEPAGGEGEGKRMTRARLAKK